MIDWAPSRRRSRISDASLESPGHRYPGQITFVREQTIALFDEIVRNIPDLAVLYRQRPISPNVILVRAAVVNTGKKDIAASMVDRPLTLRLPDDCKWLSPTLIGTSEGVTASLNQPHDAILTVSITLLRCKEFVRFQALAEVPLASPTKSSDLRQSGEKRFETTLRFEHRIQDTQAVRQIELGETERMRRRLRHYLALPGFGVVMVVLLAVPLVHSGLFKRFAFQFQLAPGKTMTVTEKLTGSSLVSVRSLDGSYRDRLSPREFFAKCSGTPTVIDDRRTFLLVLCTTIASYIVLPSAVLFAALRQYRSDMRLHRVLGVH